MRALAPTCDGGTGWETVISFTHPSLYTPPHCIQGHSQYGRCREEKKFSPLPKIEPRFLRVPVHSLTMYRLKTGERNVLQIRISYTFLYRIISSDNNVTNILLTNKENCALKLVDEIILYDDARSKKHQITFSYNFSHLSSYLLLCRFLRPLWNFTQFFWVWLFVVLWKTITGRSPFLHQKTFENRKASYAVVTANDVDLYSILQTYSKAHFVKKQEGTPLCTLPSTSQRLPLPLRDPASIFMQSISNFLCINWHWANFLSKMSALPRNLPIHMVPTHLSSGMTQYGSHLS